MEYHCVSCGREITKEEAEELDGYCSLCYETEIQFSDEDSEEE